MFFGKLKAFIIGNRPPEIKYCLLVVQICFISDQHDRNFIVGVAFSFIKPFIDIIEGFPAGDVINEDNPN